MTERVAHALKIIISALDQPLSQSERITLNNALFRLASAQLTAVAQELTEECNAAISKSLQRSANA